jgi:hypothetical protein
MSIFLVGVIAGRPVVRLFVKTRKDALARRRIASETVSFVKEGNKAGRRSGENRVRASHPVTPWSGARSGSSHSQSGKDRQGIGRAGACAWVAD